MGTGQVAPNPADEVINFETAVFSLRYGVHRKVNLTATIPYLSIDSDKIQGAPYRRINKGMGDLVVAAEFAVMSAPQVTFLAGLKLPTGSVENVDQFGQRICDILALGSGTVDPVLGFGIWIPHALVQHLDLVGGARHKITGGQNKFGYRYGAETSFSLHASHPWIPETRMGVRLEGFHTEPDTWYGNTVPERGATMLYAGPTFSWQATPETSLGLYARVPIIMDLEGSQMVAPAVFGLEMSTNLGSALRSILPSGGE